MNKNYLLKNQQLNSAEDPCSQSFGGKEYFSEPETKAVKDLIENDGNYSAALNFYSASNIEVKSRPYG